VYNTGYILGSIYLNVESLRGMVDGVPSMLLPGFFLAAHFSAMGIFPTDMVIIVTDRRYLDATLVAIALERLGHTSYAILNGGMDQWIAEKRPLSTELPSITATQYPIPKSDEFTVNGKAVLQAQKSRRALILDVRPVDYYTGKKQDEARGGHIPGAINRPFDDDIAKGAEYHAFLPIEELTKIYQAIIPDKTTHVIVHCRTGHQASQTFFVLRSLLGYENVQWYDGGWTEWAAKPEFPVEKN